MDIGQTVVLHLQPGGSLKKGTPLETRATPLCGLRVPEYVGAVLNSCRSAVVFVMVPCSSSAFYDSWFTSRYFTSTLQIQFVAYSHLEPI